MRRELIVALVTVLLIGIGRPAAGLPGPVISNEITVDVQVTGDSTDAGSGPGSSSSEEVDPSGQTELKLPGVLDLLAPSGSLTGGTLTAIVLTEEEARQIAAAAAAGQHITGVGEVVEITLTGGEFKGNLTLTMAFNPELIPAGQTPAVYVFNQRTRKWVYAGGNCNPPTGTITLTLSHLSTYSVFARPSLPALSDVSGHWAETEITTLLGMDIINGYADSTYRPSGWLTRAEAATVVARSLGIAAASDDTWFRDTAGNWGGGFITALAGQGLICGYPDGSCRPDEPITRAELVTMLTRAIDQGLITPQNCPERQFADELAFPPWTLDAIRRSTRYGLVRGYPDGTFGPDRFVERAEAAAIIYRLVAER